MKMKKSFGAISLALLGLLALASCNNPTDSKQAPTNSPTVPT